MLSYMLKFVFAAHYCYTSRVTEIHYRVEMVTCFIRGGNHRVFYDMEYMAHDIMILQFCDNRYIICILFIYIIYRNSWVK